MSANSLHRRALWIVAAVGTVLWTAGNDVAVSQDSLEVDIVVEKDTAFFDRDLGLRIQGLDPSSEIIVTVSATDARGQSWWSQNVYVADAHGEIDPARHEPVRGTYSGSHPMGPFWSMIGAERFYTSASADVRIRVADETGSLAERTVTWLSPRDHPDITKEAIRLPDLVADLYLPSEREDPVPAVVVLGGSGGGFNSERASLLATHGYAALDIAYFGVEGTPRYFVESMPLERFMRAIVHLARDPRIDASRIAVMGRSYGAQLALLLGSHDPRIRVVIAEAPSSFVAGTPATYPEGPVSSAWSLAGEPLPFLGAGGQDTEPADRERIRVPAPEDSAPERAPAAHPAAISAERINGPVLLITGEADPLWPSMDMAEQLVRRMETHAFEHAVQHVHYADAGHNFGGGEQAYGVPNLPPKDRGDSRGGTRQGNSVAGVAAWAEALAFLRSHLGR